MSSRPSRREIAENDSRQLKRQKDFRAAADAVAALLCTFDEVERVSLFGSVAKPLQREVPRFQPFRRLGIAILHECKDVDLAIWLTHTNRLRDLGRACSLAVKHLFNATGVGVAQHQVEVFVLAAATGHYLGRLCTFATCPKLKPECHVPGCGATAFLKQLAGFQFNPDALTGSIVLFDRQSRTQVPG